MFWRKPIRKWPLDRIADQVVAVYCRSDGYKASAILDVPERLIPRREVKEMGRLPYYLFGFGFDDEDRVAIYMEGVHEDLVRQYGGMPDIESAEVEAKKWAESEEPISFDHLPGIYKWALFESVRGEPVEPMMATYVWNRPEGYIEQFPPRLEGTESD